MAAVMQDNLNGQLTILKSQLEELAISFGDALMPAVRKIVTAIQGFIDNERGTEKCHPANRPIRSSTGTIPSDTRDVYF